MIHFVTFLFWWMGASFLQCRGHGMMHVIISIPQIMLNIVFQLNRINSKRRFYPLKQSKLM